MTKSGNACPLGARDARKLAKAARELAMECLTNGPEMENIWCGCSIGLSLKGAGLWRGDDGNVVSEGLAERLEGWFSRVYYAAQDGILSTATRIRRRAQWGLDGNEPTAVVIPLLAFADELEEAHKGSK